MYLMHSCTQKLPEAGTHLRAHAKQNYYLEEHPPLARYIHDISHSFFLSFFFPFFLSPIRLQTFSFSKVSAPLLAGVATPTIVITRFAATPEASSILHCCYSSQLELNLYFTLIDIHILQKLISLRLPLNEIVTRKCQLFS